MRYLLIFISLLLSPFVSVFSHPGTICQYLAQNPTFKEDLKQVEYDWGVQPGLILAIIFKESSFKPDVVGTAGSLGYSQAKPDIWKDYTHKRHRPQASRTSFRDSVDFIGWYLVSHAKRGHTDVNDAFRGYLYYRLGYNGSKHCPRTHIALKQAKMVERFTKSYTKDLEECYP